MSAYSRNRENRSVAPAPLDQNSTQCRLLGVDREGHHHVYDRSRNRIVVLDESGIEVQYDLDELDQDVGDWMHYVRESGRGWTKEQWLGYRYVEALTDSVQEGDL